MLLRAVVVVIVVVAVVVVAVVAVVIAVVVIVVCLFVLIVTQSSLFGYVSPSLLRSSPLCSSPPSSFITWTFLFFIVNGC